MKDNKAAAAEVDQSLWRFGRFDGRPGRSQLLFGRMFEDASIERNAFSSGDRVFCIASAGCIAIELARYGCRVTAVDINPSQIAYVRRRLNGGPIEIGKADRIMAVVRRAVRMFGVRQRDLEAFVEMDDPAGQHRFWRALIDRPALRTAGRIVFSAPVLRLVYASPFTRWLPERFVDELRWRIERGISVHPNHCNPFAWRLFVGHEPAGMGEPGTPRGVIELATADAADYLRDCPAGTFQGFALSNILDGIGVAFAARLLDALRHAAAPGAVAVLRSFTEPQSQEEEKLAAADRSLLWGRILVRRVDQLTVADLTPRRRNHKLLPAS